MIIDFHTHCFPDKLAPRAIPQLSHAAGGLVPCTDGTASGLLACMEQDGITVSVVQNIATSPHQQRAVNGFAAELNSERLVAFGSVHPDAEDVLDELDRIKELGLKGVKFHPEYQGFDVDDPKMKPIYRKISRLGLITLFHAGYDYGFRAPYHCMPRQMAKALLWFDSPVVAAHWGGLCCGEEVITHLCGLPLYFDLSFGYGTMPKAVAQEIIERHGVKKLLFGSDCPWHRPSLERHLLDSLELTLAEQQDIYWNNGAALLGLKTV